MQKSIATKQTTDATGNPETETACQFCKNGYRGSDVECVNGILIDIDEYTEGWQRDVIYPPAPCHPLYCKTCNGSGWCPEDVNHDSDDCPGCEGTGYVGGGPDCQERLRGDVAETRSNVPDDISLVSGASSESESRP